MSLFNNSKDKDTKAKVCNEPCEGCPNTRTTELPQTPYNPEETTGEPMTVDSRAEFNKNRLTKITIESPNGDTQVLEVHGVAMTTIKDIGDRYEASVGVIGTLNPKEQVELFEQAKHQLVPQLEELIIKHFAENSSLKDMVNVLRDVFGGK